MRETVEMYVNDMLDAYVEAALWAGLDYTPVETGEDDNPIPLDENYGPEDVSDEAMAELRQDCHDFATDDDGREIIPELGEITPEQAGHDFYLTRNGHGAGFWARGLGQVGEFLTARCRPYGSSDLYPGDDGKLYVQ